MPRITSAVEGLWLDTAPSTDYPTPTGSVEVDLAVIGGGIAGLTSSGCLRRPPGRVGAFRAVASASSGHDTRLDSPRRSQQPNPDG